MKDLNVEQCRQVFSHLQRRIYCEAILSTPGGIQYSLFCCEFRCDRFPFQGIGRFLAHQFLKLAKKSGYLAVFFNLVCALSCPVKRGTRVMQLQEWRWAFRYYETLLLVVHVFRFQTVFYFDLPGVHQQCRINAALAFPWWVQLIFICSDHHNIT